MSGLSAYPHLKDITDNVYKVVEDNDDKVTRIVDDLGKESKDLREGMAAANSSMQELEALVSSYRLEQTKSFNRHVVESLIYAAILTLLAVRQLRR